MNSKAFFYLDNRVIAKSTIRRNQRMAIEYAAVAATAVKILSPFMPFLIDEAKAGGQKFAEVVGEHGGEAVWEKAKAVWGKLTGHYGDDVEMTGAATMLAAKPANENYQAQLAEIIGNHLKENPDLAREILSMVGGQQSVQEVLAEHESFVSDVGQRMTTPGGRQTVSAKDNSFISGVRQIIGGQGEDPRTEKP
jgi:hypothetical protein